MGSSDVMSPTLGHQVGREARGHEGDVDVTAPPVLPKLRPVAAPAGGPCHHGRVTRVVTLPSGGQVRGRKLADPPTTPAGFLLALAEGPLPAWPYRRIAWRDFWVPTDRVDAIDALREALKRTRDGELVEVACRGGRGRTGTAIAALAVLDGMPPEDAIRWVRSEYDSHAIETPWQARWVRRLPVAPTSPQK